MANKAIPIVAQATLLQKRFPQSSISIDKDQRLIWRWEVQPSPISPIYTIKMVYNYKKHPNVYVINPNPLPLAPNKVCLPHVYDTQKQHLCIYFRPGKEWTPDQIIADTVSPWIAEWLYHYEIWQYTGEWTGGGFHSRSRKKKK